MRSTFLFSINRKELSLMSKTQRALTEAECVFAETHHHLVVDYLRRRHLPESEFYDAVIDRYIRTVQLYCSNPELRRYKFKTILRKTMDWAIKDYWRDRCRHAQRFVSMDAAWDETGAPLHELLPGDVAAEEAACDILTADALLAALSEPQHKLLNLRMDGYEDEEIAKKLGMPVADVESSFTAAHAVLTAAAY